MSAVYHVSIVDKAQKQLKRLPVEEQLRIQESIDSLASDPWPAACRKIKGVQGCWRVRVGDYRVVYEVHHGELLVLVVRVAHRKEVYR